jgi:hypothetical protein
MLLRLEETAVGGAIGAAVALLVLPIRTRAVVAASRHDLLAALQTLLIDLGEWLRSPGRPVALAGHVRALDAQLHQMQTITRTLTTRLSPFATGRDARRHLLVYEGLSYHARRIARTARACTRPDPRIADGLARACDQLVILAEHLAPPAPRLRRTSLSATDDLLTALHMAAGCGDRLDSTDGSLSEQLGQLHDALIELAEVHGFVLEVEEAGAPGTAPAARHGQPPDSGPALAPAFPSSPNGANGSSAASGASPGGAVWGHVFGPDYAAGDAVVTLVDLSGRQRASTVTDAGDYQLTAPAPGSYLLVCIPRAESTHGAGPHAGLVSMRGRPLIHDVVLPRQTTPALAAPPAS